MCTLVKNINIFWGGCVGGGYLVDDILCDEKIFYISAHSNNNKIGDISVVDIFVSMKKKINKNKKRNSITTYLRWPKCTEHEPKCSKYNDQSFGTCAGYKKF